MISYEELLDKLATKKKLKLGRWQTPQRTEASRRTFLDLENIQALQRMADLVSPWLEFYKKTILVRKFGQDYKVCNI